MKKIVALLTCIFVLICSFASSGCQEEQPTAQNGTVTVKYFAAASDMLPMLKTGQLNIGLLPEPAATQLTKMASDKTWYRTDVQALYGGESAAYPQAVVMVKQSLLSSYPNLVSNMETAFSENVTWIKENTEDAVTAVNSALEEGLTASLKVGNITEEVIENCKIYWQGALDAKASVQEYLNDIISVNSISAKAVGDDFFYNGNASGTYSKDTIQVFAPDGAPALSIAKMISENANFGTDKEVNYTVVNANTIGSKVSLGTGDIVIIPVNAASKLFKSNADDPYMLAGVITHGNLYIMSTAPFVTLADKTIGVIGEGLVPDLTLRSILAKNKIAIKLAE